MGTRRISGSSFSMNNEVNFLGKRTITKSKGKSWPKLNSGSVREPVNAAAFVGSVMGAIPTSAGTGAVSGIKMAALGALSMAGTIHVKQDSSTGLYTTAYALLLQKVMNGAYAKNGNLSEQELRQMIMDLINQMLVSAGPAFANWKQVLMYAMQNATLSDFMKGVQSAICAITGDPVNANTGNFIYDKEDLVIQGRLPLSFKRFYNRIDNREGSLGKGWRHNYEIQLLIEEDRYVIIWEDGREEIYIREEGQAPEALFGCISRLEETPNGFCYLTQDGFTYRFDQNGNLITKKDKNDQGLSFVYDEKNRLSRVSNGMGSHLMYYYEDNTGRLVRVQDQSKRTVTFTYELGRLAKVTDPLGQSYSYYYDKDKSIYRIRNPRDVFVLENEYDDQGRTIHQQFADGGIIQYDYQDQESRTFMTEQNGNRIAYVRDDRYRNVKTIYIDGEESFAYNDRNQITQRTDKNGNKTKFSYDAQGNTTQVIYPDGSKHNMTYDANNRLLVVSINGKVKVKNNYDAKGKLLSSEDALGRGQTYTRADDGTITRITKADGSNISLKYDERGNIVQVIDAAGNGIIYHYDELNRVIKTMDGNGNQTRYFYDAGNQITKVINAEGNSRSYEYTKNGKVSRVVDFNGAVINQSYNVMNEVNEITTPDGGIVTLEYDLMQNVTRRVEPTGAEFLYHYDPLNRLEKMTLPTGGVITYEYDPNGNRTAVIDANRNKTSIEYDERNRVTAIRDVNGATTEYEYDMDGNLVAVINADGHSQTYTYDAAGQKISETDILGNTIQYEYNELGKIVCITDAKGRKVLYEYGAGGVLTKTSYPNETWEAYTYDKNSNLIRRENHKGDYLGYDYDCMDRLVVLRSSFGQTQSYTYDAAGNVTAVRDANGNMTRYEYSPGGNLIAVLDAAGNKTEYAYDGNAQLTAVFRHLGKETLLGKDGDLLSVKSPFLSGDLRLTRYERDGMGKVTRVIDPLGKEETYQYDAMGQLTKKVDKEGFQTAYTYTPVHQLETITYNDGRSVAFSYNALRQLIQIKDWLGITSIQPDRAGRAEKITDYKGREVCYQWSQTGEREAIIYPDGRTVSYQYDAMGQLCYLEDGITTVDYQYNADGFLTGKKYANQLETSYGYDQAGRMESLIHRYEDVILEEYHYKYDLIGNKTEIRKERNAAIDVIPLPEEIRAGLRNQSGIYQYQYDELNRLTGVRRNQMTLRSYEYDAFGNRVRQYDAAEKQDRYYTYNAMDQLVKTGQESYQYDQRGNLTGVLKDGKMVTGYQYDETNRLSKAVNARGEAACYTYNGLGNRTRKQEYQPGIGSCNLGTWDPETEISPTKEIDYLLDMTKGYHNMLSKSEITASGETKQDYTWDGNVISMTEGDSAYIYLQDELGSPVRLLDMQGNYQIAYGYDEFGQDLMGNQGEVQPFGYTGYQMDGVGNTYFAQAREYVPGIGRFGGEDVVKGIVALPKSLNTYWYCMGSPINFVDLNGKFVIPVVVLPPENCEAPLDRMLSMSPQPPEDYVSAGIFSNKNCYTYAFDLRGRYDPGEIRYKDIYATAVYYGITVDEAARWVLADMEVFDKEVRIVDSIEDKLEDEYIVAMRISNGTKKGLATDWDYHFAVLLSDGTWADKQGRTASRWNAISDKDDAWLMNGKPFYDSKVVYFAVKKEGAGCEITN